MTDWLTNYAGGFVRRGLAGTALGTLSDLTAVPANHLAIWISLVCYLLLAAWFLKYSTKIFPAILILSCIVIGFPAYQDTIVRKDCLGLLLFLGCLKIQDARISRFLTTALINAIAALAILCHESFAFYALPALIAFASAKSPLPPLRGLLVRSAELLPALAVFLLTVRYHGTPEIATKVHESWLPLWHSIEPSAVELSPGASIRALGWNTGQGMHLSLYMIKSGLYQPMAWLAVFVVSFVLIIWFTARDGEMCSSERTSSRVRFTALLAAQLCFISPLLLLGVDWGRWLFFCVASAMMLHTLKRRPPVWLEAALARAFRRGRLGSIFERTPAKDWVLLAFGVPVCWSAHGFIVANPLMRYLEIVRSWI